MDNDSLRLTLAGFEELFSAPETQTFDLTWHSLNGTSFGLRQREGFGHEIIWHSPEQQLFNSSQRSVICRLRVPHNPRDPYSRLTSGLDVVTVPYREGCDEYTEKFLSLCKRAAVLLPADIFENLGKVVGDLNRDPSALWIEYLLCVYAEPIQHEVNGQSKYHSETTVYRPIHRSIEALKQLESSENSGPIKLNETQKSYVLAGAIFLAYKVHCESKGIVATCMIKRNDAFKFAKALGWKGSEKRFYQHAGQGTKPALAWLALAKVKAREIEIPE